MADSYETGVFVGLDRERIPADFDLVAKIRGNGNQNLRYIEKSTQSRISVRGRGSGTIDHRTKQESGEPLHIQITSDTLRGLETAEQLVESLVKSIKKEFHDLAESERRERERKRYEEERRRREEEEERRRREEERRRDAEEYERRQRALEQEAAQKREMRDNMGNSRFDTGRPFCSLCKIECASADAYRMHINGSVHMHAMQELRRGGGHGGGGGGGGGGRMPEGGGRMPEEFKPQMNPQMKQQRLTREQFMDVMDSFKSLHERQVHVDNFWQLQQQLEDQVAKQPGAALLQYMPVHPRPLDPNYCILCRTSTPPHMPASNHLWSREHRTNYLKMQLNLGLSQFSRVYGQIPLPDRDTFDGRQIAEHCMDHCFQGSSINSSPSFKTMIILTGHLANYKCGVCEKSTDNLSNWISHVIGLSHARACVKKMLQQGQAEYIALCGNVPAPQQGTLEDAARDFLSVEDGSPARPNPMDDFKRRPYDNGAPREQSLLGEPPRPYDKGAPRQQSLLGEPPVPPLMDRPAMPVPPMVKRLQQLNPNERALALQIKSMTGIEDMDLVMQTLEILRQLDTDILGLLSDLSPQNVSSIAGSVMGSLGPQALNKISSLPYEQRAAIEGFLNAMRNAGNAGKQSPGMRGRPQQQRQANRRPNRPPSPPYKRRR